MRRGLFVLWFALLMPVWAAAQDTAQPVQTPEPIPTALPAAPASVIAADALPLLINARTDMELLANQVLGSERPIGWSGSIDASDANLPLLMRLDLELLAGQMLGTNTRPVGWFGAVPSSVFAISRDIRHDLELLADSVNPANVRPPGWAGADALMHCDRATQSLVTLLERTTAFRLTVDANEPSFCSLASMQASRVVETGLPAASGGAAAAVAGSPSISGQFAVAFRTRFGTQPAGTIPVGEVITPVARSYVQFSRMMLVRGTGFELFIDYRDSTVSDADFEALPNIDNVSSTPNCTAAWCG
jgi:hypothetical protein